MNRTMRAMLVLLATGAIGTVLTVVSLQYARDARSAATASATPSAADAVDPENESITEDVSIRRGDNLAGLLERAGVDQAVTAAMIVAVKEAFDVKKLRAGMQLTLTRSGSGILESLEYIIDPDRKLRLENSGGVYQAAIVDIPGTIREVPVCGTLQGSLFESIERTGESSELAIRMAEVFAWDLDFYTDPREGDEFCLVVEKKEYLNGQPATYPRLLAAKYNNAGTVYDAHLFPDEDGTPRYYSRDGRSLQSAFLRSPMKFEARVSSGFTHRRFHPVLKRYRPHLGTDYAAPTGTPVQAVASGSVIFSGHSGGAGNLIKIKHSGGYETQYLHLSRRFVRPGQRVQQGERIGLVGATGLATGPHLDFRLCKNGKFLDFEGVRLPGASRIDPEQSAAFAAARDGFLALMESGSAAVTAMASGTSTEATSLNP